MAVGAITGRDAAQVALERLKRCDVLLVILCREVSLAALYARPSSRPERSTDLIEPVLVRLFRQAIIHLACLFEQAKGGFLRLDNWVVGVGPLRHFLDDGVKNTEDGESAKPNPHGVHRLVD